MTTKSYSSEPTNLMKEKIRASVKAGLADVRAGREHELTDGLIEALKNEAERRLKPEIKIDSTWV